MKRLVAVLIVLIVVISACKQMDDDTSQPSDKVTVQSTRSDSASGADDEMGSSKVSQGTPAPQETKERQDKSICSTSKMSIYIESEWL